MPRSRRVSGGDGDLRQRLDRDVVTVVSAQKSRSGPFSSMSMPLREHPVRSR